MHAANPAPGEPSISSQSTDGGRRAWPGPRLNQPWRAVVAGLEVVVAAVLVIVAVWCWRSGSTNVVIPKTGDHPDLVSTLYFGNWLAAAIGLATLAGLLVLNALRQLVLAIRT